MGQSTWGAEQVRAKHGGKSCIGSRTKLEKCNIQSCPDEELQSRAATIATTTTTASTTSRATATKTTITTTIPTTTTTIAATTGSEKGRNLASASSETSTLNKLGPFTLTWGLPGNGKGRCQMFTFEWAC